MSEIRADSLINGVGTGSPNFPNGLTSLSINGNGFPSSGALSNRNLIINGAMQVAQRGTSSTSQGYQTVDRFTSYFSGVSITQSQQSLTSGDPYNDGFRYFLRVANTSTSSATNAYVQVDQPIEAQNIAQSGWQYTNSNSFVVCSFWARSSLSGTYFVQYRAIDAVDAGRTLQINKSFILSANTWTKVTHTIPGGTNVVVNNDNGNGFQITITPYYGTDYTDSSVNIDTWYYQDSSTFLPDFSQNWCNTASATFDFTGVQLELGTVATPFEHRSYGDELARCQRYYYKVFPGVSNANFGGAYCATTSQANGTIPFPTNMRTAPTSLEQSGTASDYAVANRSVLTACTSVPTIGGARSVNACRVSFTTGATLNLGDGATLNSNSTAGFLAFSAEL